jgi:hypothetical protein
MHSSRRESNVAFAPATFGYVIEQYLASDQFTKRAHNTRRAYRSLLNRLKEICGRGLMSDLQERHVRYLREQFKSTSAADGAVMLIRLLRTFAKDNLAICGALPACAVGLGWEPQMSIARTDTLVFGPSA